MNLGKKVSLNSITFSLPVIVLFTSTFCSKCMWNRNLFSQYSIFRGHIVEIDISQHHKLIEELKPLSVPYAVIITKEGIIIAEKYGLFTEEEVKVFIKTLEKLLGRFPDQTVSK